MNVMFGSLGALYVASLLCVLFVNDRAWLLGASAFLITFLIGVLGQRKGGSSPESGPYPLIVVLALISLLFLLPVVFFAGDLGAPDTTGEPLLAERPIYTFSRGGPHHEVPRWRYLAVAGGFASSWHLFGLTIALSQWHGQIKRLSATPGAVPSPPDSVRRQSKST